MLYAHTRDGMPECEWQLLEAHLSAVAQLAAEFAKPFGAGDFAYILGKVHDAGKASKAFQDYLKDNQGRVDHSTYGAQLLAKRYGPVGELFSYAICGHHGGLPNGYSGEMRTSLSERLQKTVEPVDISSLGLGLPSTDVLMKAFPKWLHGNDSKQLTYSMTFLLRMLFSCLVDADFLDTEKFVDPDRASLREQHGMTLEQMRAVLAEKTKMMSQQEQTPINVARSDIHAACVNAAKEKPGVFTLTVPTGGGKTLSSLAFALEHAIANRQQRIIYAIPFTSIVEQTAATFKGLFGDDSVLEHHSSYKFHEREDEDGERFMRERLAMENWDANLVVTTNVQLFESIYADNPSRCRKNHNLADSVIILDEAQSIPDGVLAPCLAALDELATHYGTTVVLCTATPPALDAVWPFPVTTRDIVPMSGRHADVFESRVRIENIGEICEETLAARLCEYNQVLCIVSTRRAASEIFDHLAGGEKSDGVFHLSALMIPAHRSEVISKIKERLANNLPCKVVSTQLIEAGVDIDFPVVYRELAGIDSIKQADGRCNREGHLGCGHVYVFDCPEIRVTKYWLGNMRALGRETIANQSDPFGDSGIRYFFRARYQVQETDQFDVMAEFASPGRLEGGNLPFESCGREFRLVDDSGTSVFVPLGERGGRLLAAIRNDSLDIREMREIQRFSVNVAPWQLRDLEDRSAVAREGGMNMYVLEPHDGTLGSYSTEKGLLLEDEAGACTI